MFNSQYKAILTGWRKHTGPKLWCFSLRPQHHLDALTGAATASLKAFSAYDIPSAEVLVRYLHAVDGFPVHSIWLAAIKSCNYYSWPGLTYHNSINYCPASTYTLLIRMKQTHQGLRSTMLQRTKTKMAPVPPAPPTDPSVLSNPPSNELHVSVEHILKLYTYDTGRFPVCSQRFNQYIIIAYHCDPHVIPQALFQTKKDTHHIAVYFLS